MALPNTVDKRYEIMQITLRVRTEFIIETSSAESRSV